VCHNLWTLHFPEPHPPVPISEVPPAAVTEHNLAKVLKSLPHGSTAGPSGWTYEYVKAATSTSDDTRAAVLRLMQAVVHGDLPHLPCPLDARLLPLEKPSSGIRPIAVGEVWYRLAALCALAACPNAGHSLVALQVIVGVPGGSQIVRHTLWAGLSANPSCVTVQVDWQNAFNTLRRERMLDAVAQRCPALLRMAAWAYGRHSHLLVHQSLGPVVRSQSGVRQVDPLGPLLFAPTLQGPLEEVAAMGLARPLTYADDTFLQGALAPTMQAFTALTALAALLGIYSQPAKCAVHFGDHAAATAVADQLGMRHAPEGLPAAGTPIGTPSFQTANAESCATRACHLMDELLAQPLGDQDRWLVLHGSLRKRVAHLPRGCSWEHVGPAVVCAESKAVDCAFAIMAQARMDGPPTDQLTLPLRHGGLGLVHTGPEEGDAAYLSAVAPTQLAMRHWPTEFRPFDGPSGAQLRPQWEGLHDKAETLWRPDDRVVSQDSMGTIAEAQRAYCRHSAQACADALLASLHDLTEDGKHGRARLFSCACCPASAWLDTLPLSRALELKSGEFQTALRQRLGLAILPLHAPTVHPRALRPPLSHPSANSQASLPALKPPPMARPFAPRLGASSSWPFHRASPSPTFLSSTLSPSIPSPGRLPWLEWRHPIGTSRRGLGMHELSHIATASYPSLWRRTVALASRR
jgi:hypothetical protein